MNQHQQDIDENLLLQYLLGNADNTLRNSVEKWLESDGRNRKHLDQLESLWLEAGKLDPPPLPVDLEKAWGRLSDRIEKHETAQTALPGKPVSLRYLKFALSAAALILLVFGTYAVLRMLTGKGKEIEILSAGSIVYDTLPDGSRVMINKQSKLTFSGRFQGEKRLVKLTGGAFFEVSKDPLKPFVVDAGIAKVKVLGTVFSVSAYPGKAVQVTVTEGRVLFFTLDSLDRDTLSIVLEAGMSGVLEPGAPKPAVVENPGPDKLFWVNHTLDFKGTPLSEVFGLVEKYYGVKISVSTPDILNCRLFASFANDPVNRIMNVIAESFGLKLSVEGNTCYLSGDGCSKGNN